MRASFLRAPLLCLIFIGTIPRFLPAQTTQDCVALMQYGIYDRYRTFTTASEYKLVQSFFAQYQFSSRQEAEAKAGSLGLDIIDILNLNIGGNSSSTNYSQWVNSLESMTYDQFSSTYTVSQSIDKISSKITDLGCVHTI